METRVAPTAGVYFPTPHMVHSADPPAPLYLPATHAVHGPPSGPVYAALHVQSVILSLDVGDVESDGQLKQ